MITGASSGIGEATEHLAARGALLARRTGHLHDPATRIGKHGGQALALVIDVTDAEALRAAAADRVRSKWGPVELLFNNAVVMLPTPVEDVAVDQRRQQIDLNITGLVNAIAGFAPQLIEAAGANGVADLINTSSIVAQNILPRFAVYSGTRRTLPTCPGTCASSWALRTAGVGDRAGHRRHRAQGSRDR
ncbi:SDR family oxidoreductase [Herbidospora mongoliensis]|uniref:SDR family oxidoreductase n=1 Tax=Herbidospora mongoliensis TaxID=688067 RepID=UPI001FDF73C6|nr:SDR family NAD(P)-dependent oxidoreductase [Herbidospora mongoliensis]